MTKKWKFNDIKGRYKVHGEGITHPECNAVIGHVFPAGSEVLSSVVECAIEDSDELGDILDDL